MFDDILDLLPTGAALSVLSVKPNGDALVNVKTDNWQLGYTGQDPAELLERAWAEQSAYEAQQAIKAQNAAYKQQLRDLSAQNTAQVKQVSDEHTAKKQAAIENAKAAYQAKKDKA